MRYFILFIPIFIVFSNSCTYDSSVSITNNSNDTLLYFYKIQKLGDSTLNFISGIDKEYILSKDTLFRNQYILYPNETRKIIKHGKWINSQTKNDSIKINFYFFYYKTFKNFEMDEILSNRMYFKLNSYSIYDLKDINGKISIR